MMLDGTSQQTATGCTRFCKRLGPLAIKDQYLGSVDQASARESDKFRLLSAPSGERFGPLLCAVLDLVVLADLDDAAIDETCDDR